MHTPDFWWSIIDLAEVDRWCTPLADSTLQAKWMQVIQHTQYDHNRVAIYMQATNLTMYVIEVRSKQL